MFVHLYTCRCILKPHDRHQPCFNRVTMFMYMCTYVFVLS